MKAVLRKGKHCSVVQQRFVASQHRSNASGEPEALLAKCLLAGLAARIVDGAELDVRGWHSCSLLRGRCGSGF